MKTIPSGLVASRSQPYCVSFLPPLSSKEHRPDSPFSMWLKTFYYRKNNHAARETKNVFTRVKKCGKGSVIVHAKLGSQIVQVNCILMYIG